MPFKSEELQESYPSYRDRFDSDDDVDDEDSLDSCLPGGVNAQVNDLAMGLARKETIAVYFGKFIVFFVLVVAATLMGYYVKKLTSDDQMDNYQKAFSSHADEIVTKAESNAAQTISIIRSISTAATSFADRSDLNWPFVTIPDFELRAQEVLELSGSDMIFFSPIVSMHNVDPWGVYSFQNQGWIEAGLKANGVTNVTVDPIKPFIHQPGGGSFQYTNYVPLWQFAPAPTTSNLVNMDLYNHFEWFRGVADGVKEVRHVLMSGIVDVSKLLAKHAKGRAVTVYPMLESLEDRETSAITGFLSAIIPWEKFLVNIFPSAEVGQFLDVVVHDGCGNDLTFSVSGPTVELKGEGALFSKKHEEMGQHFEFATFARLAEDIEVGEDAMAASCPYTMSIYPTDSFKNAYVSNEPRTYTLAVLGVFLFTAIVFTFYDLLVHRRQSVVMETAKQTTQLVQSLFPSNVQNRVLEQVTKKKGRSRDTLNDSLKHYFSRADNESRQGKPIADLFPEATVMFGDIKGFTAWSSTREPAQVFILLENIYGHFDDIAKKRRVFKVETVGDCYVAVTGLPEARKDHAIAMARFAHACQETFSEVTKRLEIELGPDTGDLQLRVGLHSGPVTAGVLRGERARFQLFGDTMNTASRIETNGQGGRIHVSQETAEQIIAGGKSHWLSLREEKINAKGKGELQTYWVNVRLGGRDDDRSETGSESADLAALSQSVTQLPPAPDMSNMLGEKVKRLIDWNVDLLVRLLKKIEAHRQSINAEKRNSVKDDMDVTREAGTTVLDEVREAIAIPQFKKAEKVVNPDNIQVAPEVFEEVKDYVTSIAFMYRDNPFHNFEHCSHVAMSVSKLLSRIVAPKETRFEKPSVRLETKHSSAQIASTMHDHTYGITSDPLTQFACVFSALIHDVDHTGVPNPRLIEENPTMAARYNGKSVAEQNSVDLAWDLLWDKAFTNFRNMIFIDEEELHRFRQLVVNSVMATDIMDKELKNLRNARWDKAFEDVREVDSLEDTNRKATIVIEHIIQASDVSHTMQHWHIYRKWNERLFFELSKAFREGRSEKDPADFWYEGEIGFFDFYIIPLAEKLKACGVFGVSSFEYLNYAQKNRREWEARGKEVVSEMIDKIKQGKDEIGM